MTLNKVSELGNTFLFKIKPICLLFQGGKKRKNIPKRRLDKLCDIFFTKRRRRCVCNIRFLTSIICMPPT